MIAEFDRREGARRAGFRSTPEWLAWRCHLSARTARPHPTAAPATPAPHALDLGTHDDRAPDAPLTGDTAAADELAFLDASPDGAGATADEHRR
jgi:hypothetical protein